MNDPILVLGGFGLYLLCLGLVCAGAIVLKRGIDRRDEERRKRAKWSPMLKAVAATSSIRKEVRQSMSNCVLCGHPHKRAPTIVFDKWPVCKPCVDAYDERVRPKRTVPATDLRDVAGAQQYANIMEQQRRQQADMMRQMQSQPPPQRQPAIGGVLGPIGGLFGGDPPGKWGNL